MKANAEAAAKSAESSPGELREIFVGDQKYIE
jgi:hypothetical protein